MFQPATSEVILELALDIGRQAPALRRKMSDEGRVVLFDDPVEQGLLGPVARWSTTAGSGLPARAWWSSRRRP